jgi:hypothetical protein
MNKIFQTSFAIFFALLCSLSSAIAQPAQANKPTTADVMAKRQSDFDSSASLYVSGKSALGEQVLLNTLGNKAATAMWHHEAGQQLYAMAVYLRDRGSESAAKDAINSAIKELNLCSTVANAQKKSGTAALAALQLGTIYEQFIGDRKAALTQMQIAAQLDPANQNVARAIVRLQAALAQLSSSTK